MGHKCTGEVGVSDKNPANGGWVGSLQTVVDAMGGHWLK